MSVAIAVTTFKRPERLRTLLENMTWSGLPDIPLYVFEDPVPDDRRSRVSSRMSAVCEEFNVPLRTAPTWGCMQGAIQYAMEETSEDWIIYVPDDVLFTRGALWNMYGAVLTYGRPFVGGIQTPYWNADELFELGMMPHKECMYEGWKPESISRNPHWENGGVPRIYVNLNGAGFAISRKLWKAMGGWPKQTWRLDEYAGYRSWFYGMVVITVPGPPAIHYFGGATPDMPEEKPDFSSVSAWKEATGETPEESGLISREKMAKIPRVYDGDATFNDCLSFFKSGGVL